MMNRKLGRVAADAERSCARATTETSVARSNAIPTRKDLLMPPKVSAADFVRDGVGDQVRPDQVQLAEANFRTHRSDGIIVAAIGRNVLLRRRGDAGRKRNEQGNASNEAKR